MEYLWELYEKQCGKCAITGIPIEFEKDKPNAPHEASLDRIDSSMGYVIGNVQWVHRDVNFMKSDFTMEYFLSLCKLVSDRN
jgi:hypothetical protein